MSRAGNLTNKLGRSLKGHKLVFNLPEPVVLISREGCLDNRETRIRMALNSMMPDEIKQIENVHVERRGSNRYAPHFIVNYSDYHNIDEAIARICRIMDNRNRREENENGR